VIAAAGSGERLGAGGPKALVEVAGRPMLEWSLDACRAAESIEAIVVAVPPGEEEPVAAIGGPGVEAVAGGASRGESVAAALERVDTELVAIHDAARPLVTPGLIDELVAELVSAPDAAGVIAAAPVTDTVKEAAGGAVQRTLDRSTLWAAQTPQVFRTAQLRAVLGSDGSATDEAMLVEAAGGTVLLHDSAAPNFKVTTADDLRLAEALLRG
jgi:2-C-methyl-D-erythritol 4-phosphate cytidylyltransferase